MTTTPAERLAAAAEKIRAAVEIDNDQHRYAELVKLGLASEPLATAVEELLDDQIRFHTCDEPDCVLDNATAATAVADQILGGE